MRTVPIPLKIETPFSPGAESEAYVKAVHPYAWLHGHGPEITILDCHGDYNKGIASKCLSSTFYCGLRWPREKQKEAEDQLWWWAAYLLYLDSRTEKRK